MNDFLYNIAKRALSVEDDVRPRLPSVFEPLPPGSADFAPKDRSPDTEFLDVADTRAADDAPLLISLRSQPQKADAPLGSIERSEPEPLADRSVSSRERRDLPDQHPRSNEDAEDKPVTHLSPIAEPAELRNSVSLADDHATTFDKVPTGEVAPTLNPKSTHLLLANSDNFVRNVDAPPVKTRGTDGLSPQLHRDSLLVVTRVHPTRTQRDVTDEAVAVSDRTLAPLGSHVKQTRSDWPPHRQRITSIPPISENVINVTIGRIEVRATPPSPARQRSDNQTPPVTSLDDYLRQRSGTNRGGGG